MKRQVLYIAVISFIIFTAVRLFATTQAVSGDTAVQPATQLTTMATVLIGMAIPYVFSLLANLVERKPTDGPWTALWKNILTKLLAGNYSVKAGK